MIGSRLALQQCVIARPGPNPDYYQEAIRNHVTVFPGVKTLVADLAQTLPLAVASGALRHEIETILKTLGLLDHFHAIVAAED
ncbi:MAG: HAD hydrolase-like protein, partial [Deltaproteobacteria bacterium]|nr:HAD hydrolase-like protein [Deltaproteobacteria bacterium]